MKLSDLFEDYCNVEGIQIVRVLNLDTFLAVMSAEKGSSKVTMVRYMTKTLMKKLKDKELTPQELVGEIYQWLPIQEVDANFTKSEINILIKAADSKGYVVKNNICTSCGRKNDVNSNFCTVCGKNLK